MTLKKNSKLNDQPLSWSEAVRKRPGLYIGSANNKGLVYIIKKIISGIFSHAKSDFVYLTLHDKSKVELKFHHCQNPINHNCYIINVSDAHPHFIKFNEIHPLFILEMAALNPLCSHFKVQFLNKFGIEICSQKFKYGALKTGKINSKEIQCSSFIIKFELDKEIWGEGFELNENYINNEIRDFSFFYKKNKFELIYNVDNENCRIFYHFKNGLRDKLQIKKLNDLGGSYFDTIIDEQIGNFKLEVAFAFREYSVNQPYLESYVNEELTHENGSHLDGFLKGLTGGLIKYLQKNELTEVYKISEKKMKENLIAIIHLRTETPLFGGSVRNKLTNPEIIEPIANYITELFFNMMEADGISANKLIREFVI
jgi:DNA gyrase/topoisomerase IV subunit B